MNKIDKIPYIILDNFQGYDGNVCDACGLLGYLYDRRKVNIVILTNNGFMLQKLKNDKFLMNMIEIEWIESKKEGILAFSKEINERLNNSGKIITETHIKECEKINDIDFDLLKDYEKNSKEQENFQIFCKNKVKKLLEVLKLDKFTIFFKSFVKLSYDSKNKKYENRFLSYGELKAEKIEKFEELLEEGLKTGLIESQNGKYRIFHKALYNSMIMTLA